jgi:hypothetical protein
MHNKFIKQTFSVKTRRILHKLTGLQSNGNYVSRVFNYDVTTMNTLLLKYIKVV